MSPDELERLRRLAYGRADSPEQEQRAAAARQQLAELDRVADHRRAASDLQTESPDTPTRSSRLPSAAPAAPPTFLASWRLWIVPTIAALILGAIAAGTATSASNPTTEVAATPGAVEPTAVADEDTLVISADSRLASGRGDITAAESWLDAEQTAADLPPTVPPELDAVSLRLAQSAGSASVWVARTPTGDYCLLVDAGGEGAYECEGVLQFQETGVAVETTDLTALWDGVRVTVASAAR